MDNTERTGVEYKQMLPIRKVSGTYTPRNGSTTLRPQTHTDGTARRATHKHVVLTQGPSTHC